MKKKTLIAITAGIAVSALSVYAGNKQAATPVAAVSADEIENVSNADLLKRIEALEGATKRSNWAEKITFKGDMRYRFDHQRTENSTTKSRQRIRARLGAYADVNDFTTAGIRVSTGKGANSGNQTIGNNWDAKGIYLDLAYITVAPEDAQYGAVTLGKMKFPWKNVSALIWDGDVNPEGVAYTYATKREETGLFGSVGGFKVQDTSSTHDLNLATAQAGISQPLCDDAKLTGGATLYAYGNTKDFVDPTTAAPYMVDYDIAELFIELAMQEILPVPVKFYGNYVNNTATGNDKQGACAGIKFADAKKGKWEAKVEYRYLEANAAPSYYADSDFVGGGADVKGVGVKAAYNLGKHLQVGINANTGQVISSKTDKTVVLLDLVAKF